jgi:hypothetical protein
MDIEKLLQDKLTSELLETSDNQPDRLTSELRKISNNQAIITSELIERCLHRPTDEVAWTEFIRRFTPTIRTTVEKSFQLKEKEGEQTLQYSAEMIDAVIQVVYYKITRDRCKALRVLKGSAIKPYLRQLSIITALDYLREAAIKSKKVLKEESSTESKDFDKEVLDVTRQFINKHKNLLSRLAE